MSIYQIGSIKEQPVPEVVRRLDGREGRQECASLVGEC